MSYSQYTARPVLNIAPIEIPDTSIQAGVLPYNPKTGDDDLNKLRQLHRGTHAVARNGDRIVCLPRIKNAQIIGNDPQHIQHHHNLGLVAVLVREAFIDHFHALHRPIINHRPITFLGLNDLLKECLPSGLTSPTWLGLFPRYEIEVRLFFFENRQRFLGLTLNSKTRRCVTASADQLIAAGINLQGLYVGRLCANDDPRLEPDFELIGRVSGIQNDELQLDDARDGMGSAKTRDCYVEPSPHTFANLLDQIFTDRAQEVREVLIQKGSARRVGPREGLGSGVRC